jgi:hypothetical protein
MSKRYDQFGGRFVVPIGGGIMVGTDTFLPGGVAIDGTASALATESYTQTALPFACKLTSGVRLNLIGATDAVALVSAVICKSVGGTGSLEAVGTFVWNGTCVTGRHGSAATVATGTAANFAKNDAVSISEAIGTIAAISTHQFWLGFEELYS